MATTITVPEPLAIRLQQQARVQHRSVEDVALEFYAMHSSNHRSQALMRLWPKSKPHVLITGTFVLHTGH
jgi:hypothetical protein